MIYHVKSFKESRHFKTSMLEKSYLIYNTSYGFSSTDTQIIQELRFNRTLKYSN